MQVNPSYGIIKRTPKYKEEKAITDATKVSCTQNRTQLLYMFIILNRMEQLSKSMITFKILPASAEHLI